MDTGEGILFPSRRDRWLTLLIWLGSSGCVFGAIAAFGSGEGLLFTMLFPVIMIVSAVFMLWVLYGTGYRVSEQGLNIRSGPFRMNLAIERIVSVTPSRNPLSSPGLFAGSADDRVCRRRTAHHGFTAGQAPVPGDLARAEFAVALHGWRVWSARQRR